MTTSANYTLHISTTTLSGGVTVEAMVRKAIPAGIDGPFTASVRIEGDGTPAELAANALEELHLDREFVASIESLQIATGYDGLYLTFTLHHI